MAVIRVKKLVGGFCSVQSDASHESDVHPEMNFLIMTI